MVSKTVLSFALVVTGTFSEFLAVINVVSFFGWGYRVSKTALSFALIVTGTFYEYIACINLVFVFARVKGSLNIYSYLRSSLQVPPPSL